MDTIKLLRLEANGQGVYQGLFDAPGGEYALSMWPDGRNQAAGDEISREEAWQRQPPPYADGMGGGRNEFFNEAYGPWLGHLFAFRDTVQLNRWFFPEQLARLIRLGAELVEYRVARAGLLVGGHQVAFCESAIDSLKVIYT